MNNEKQNKPVRPQPVTGLKHMLAATKYSIGGFKRLWGEAAFRQEVVISIVVLVGLFVLGAALQSILIATILILLLIAVEALNTAIECLVDHLSPEWSEFARDAKDLGSLAVMCVLLANGLYLAYVVIPLVLKLFGL